MLAVLSRTGVLALLLLCRFRRASGWLCGPLASTFISSASTSAGTTSSPTPGPCNRCHPRGGGDPSMCFSPDDATVAAQRPATLLVASERDPASVVMVEELLSRGGWIETGPGRASPPGASGEDLGDGTAWVHTNTGKEGTSCDVWLWRVPGSLVHLDDADDRWMQGGSDGAGDQDSASASTGGEGGRQRRRRPTDVVFLSRHAAASGRPALTVHPIGNPDPQPATRYGGRPGQCPPPCPRLAGCLRELHAAARSAGLAEEFDISLEATHHGPWLETPTMFVEIGSTEEHWSRKDAAQVWGDVLTSMLGLDGSRGQETWVTLGPEERAKKEAVVALGGGHYAPKHGDVARKEGVFLGHILAGYAINFEKEQQLGENTTARPTAAAAAAAAVAAGADEAGAGAGAGRAAAGQSGGGGDGGARQPRWEGAVAEAVEATRRAFPGVGSVVAHVDKKAFRSAERQAVLGLLEGMDVEARMKSTQF